MDDLKWWHWILGVIAVILSATFGAGAAYQKLLNSFQSRISKLEEKAKPLYKDDGTARYMTIEDFRREQHNCQLHMAEIFAGTKESIRDLKVSVDRMNEALIEYLAKT